MATTKAQTKIADDTTQDVPQTTTPGAAPADTTDATERVSSAPVDTGKAAKAGHFSANAVTPTDPVPAPAAPAGGGRTETYTAYDQDNKPVTVTHNIDTGESNGSGASAPATGNPPA